jgi:fused signal recognition particle receptor
VQHVIALSQDGTPPEHLPDCHRRQSIWVWFHPPTSALVKAAEGQLDSSLVGGGASLDHGPIGLAYLAVLEQKPQVSESLAMASQHEATGGILIEAVRQRGRARQAESQSVEVVFEAAASLRSAMHWKSGGLVHDQHQAIAIKNASQHLVGSNLFKRHDETGITAIDMKDSTTEAPGNSRQSWWGRLRGGLGRTSAAITSAISDLVSKRKLDAGVIEELEELLIRSDIGVDAAVRIAAAVGEGRYDKMVSPADVKAILAAEVERILLPVEKPLALDNTAKPFVILVAGVNGSGKTTTIGKLASRFSRDGQRVMLAAGDTFRAAAIEQLKIWGERTQSPVIAGIQGADAAGLAYEALAAARAQAINVLFVDTAGRLQNKAGLMDELQKIIRVMKKLDPTAPHAVLLVLDATVGQNALSQVAEFSRMAGVTGLVMTKLDGTARGGILVAIAAKYQLPVHFIGIGEAVNDLAPFEAKEFARALVGLER